MTLTSPLRLQLHILLNKNFIGYEGARIHFDVSAELINLSFLNDLQIVIIILEVNVVVILIWSPLFIIAISILLALHDVIDRELVGYLINVLSPGGSRLTNLLGRDIFRVEVFGVLEKGGFALLLLLDYISLLDVIRRIPPNLPSMIEAIGLHDLPRPASPPLTHPFSLIGPPSSHRHPSIPQVSLLVGLGVNRGAASAQNQGLRR